jgi:hypothetical protein
MKKLLLLFLVAFAAQNASAQNEYFQHNPEWTVMEVRSQYYPCVEYDTVTFYLNGDTMINSLLYKKLYARGTSRNQWWSTNPNMGCSLAPYNYPYSGYNGAIRSAGTQVLYIQASSSQDVLLYDYNLQVGDTFPYSPMTTMNPGVTVAFIDSLYTPHGYLKQFHFSTDTSKFIMEGGLSSYGLYHYCDVMLDFASYSMCYTLNDTAWWPVPGPNCDAILLDADAQPLPAFSFALFPNPAHDYVTVNLTGAVLDVVTVYNVFGEVVKTQTRDTQLYVGDLAPGIYFLQVSTRNGVLTDRLIVE